MEVHNIFVIILVTVFQGVNSGCIDVKTCEMCVETSSVFGSCRWCPVDKKCHAKGAIFTNKCSTSQNIVDKSKCSQAPKQYNQAMAKDLTLFSAVAYSPNAKQYLAKAFPGRNFQDVLQATDGDLSGYTVVSVTDKAIILAFRGTVDFKQLVTQILHVLVNPKTPFPAGGKVQGYFKNAYVKIWKKLNNQFQAIVKKYPTYPVFVTGHSLGGAMASLSSTDLVYQNIVPAENLVLYTFGQPRVGDYGYAKAHDSLVKNTWRLTHYKDVVPHLPTCKEIIVGTGCIAPGGGPYHHGIEIYYSNRAMTKYKECHGFPHNEALTCSNNIFKWATCVADMSSCLTDHKNYFNIPVGTWWQGKTAKTMEGISNKLMFRKWKVGTSMEHKMKTNVLY